ncbi:MAG TPA: hypothetical protein VF713_11900 [Thermoanaerobaculia bacterium]
MTACLAKGALLKLDSLPDDPFKPGVKVPLPVQSGQKRGSAGETRRKTDWFPSTLYVDRRFPS